MGKEKSSLTRIGFGLYRGKLTPLQAATAIQTARVNACDLLETSKLLYENRRYIHSLAFSILAIEEGSKGVILMGLFLGVVPENEGWKAYRQHAQKASWLNVAMEHRIAATFPEMPLQKAREIGAAGPRPEELDALKQLCLYSDCLSSEDGTPIFHLPRTMDRQKDRALAALHEAEAIVLYNRDYPPEELEVWLKHYREGRKKGQPVTETTKMLYHELLEKGMIKKGQWDQILRVLDTTKDEDKSQDQEKK